MKKQSSILIAKLLNKKSQPQKAASEEKIIMRDVHELIPNPKNNGYSLNEIEELASMIQLTQNIEPIILKETDDGKFMIMSGHRRRLAQLYRLENGMTDNPNVPTITREIVNEFEGVITNDEMETLNIVFPNKGQRRKLTPSEEAAELALIEPIVRKLYQHMKETGEAEGRFRTFFASVMGMSESTLQRKTAVNNVSEKIKAEIDAGNITATAAAELSGMDKDKQNEIVSAIKEKGEAVTVEAVKKAKKRTDKKSKSAAPDVPDSRDDEADNENISASDESDESTDRENTADLSDDTEDENAEINEYASIGEEINGDISSNRSEEEISAEAGQWVREKIAEQLKETWHGLETASGDDVLIWQERVRRMQEIMDFIDREGEL